MKFDSIIPIEYLKICPIDKNKAKLKEIIEFGECEKDYKKFKKTFKELLKSENCPLLENSSQLCQVENNLKAFIDFFYKLTNSLPFSLQIYWTKKALNKESFSIIAPTGFGKTTFGILFSLFFVKFLQGGKIYYLVPTKILVDEIGNKFFKYAENLGVKILTIKSPPDKQFLDENFDILISTSFFLHKNFPLLLNQNWSLVYIDDADSLIRQPQNIDKILNLIGFNEKEIEIALEIIKRKRANDFSELNILKQKISYENKGQIIAASATLSPKTKRIHLFRELLNFEIGISSTFLRNIEDLYLPLFNSDKNVLINKSVEWIQILGKGGFIFLSDDFSKDELKQYVDFLNQNNISATDYENFNSKTKEKFEKGEIQVIVGFSNIRNPLSRGIDLPYSVRYALFVSIPQFKIPLKTSFSPLNLFYLLISLKKFLISEKYNEFQIAKDLLFLRKYSFLKEENVLQNNRLKNRIERIKILLDEFLNQKNVLEIIEEDPNLTLVKNKDQYFLLISDPRGYLQASGRTSRLFPLGLTKGLSLLLAENEKLFRNLLLKLKILGYSIDFKNILQEQNLNNLLKEIDQDRLIVKKILRGEETEFKDPVKTCLIIVESPTKAKTIANFWGKPARKIYKNYVVYESSIGNYVINITATMGHFVDLVHEEGYYGVKKEKGYFIPIFEPLKICKNCKRHISISKDVCEICNRREFLEKEELINILRELAYQVNEIYLATDPDTEGEKIAFDLFSYLFPYNPNIKRIEMHEITKEEFLRRFYQPRNINDALVKAQLTRRISDRWIGFSLSEDLQRKFKNLNLSAGRVQTPVLGWIVDNFQKRKDKQYIAYIYFNNLFFDIVFEDKKIANLLRKYKDKLKIEIQTLEQKEEEINPLPPLQTSELLKNAWDELKLTADQTMDLAQDLFERGLITYHRTDAIYVSEYGKQIAREFLEKQGKINLFQPKNWGTPGTHECIRPTRPLNVEEVIEENILTQRQVLSKNHLKLYNLILNRFIASQCKKSKVENRELQIRIKIEDEILLENKKTITYQVLESGFEAFYKNFKISKIDDGNYKIEKINLLRIPKIPLFTQSTLIDNMKKKNLGRPSTYSSIIQTLFERKYVINRKGYLIPTKNGQIVYEYLINKYKNLVSENFTQKLENYMNQIERNKKDYQEILRKLFNRIFKRK